MTTIILSSSPVLIIHIISPFLRTLFIKLTAGALSRNNFENEQNFCVMKVTAAYSLRPTFTVTYFIPMSFDLEYITIKLSQCIGTYKCWRCAKQRIITIFKVF